jgi:hypothetical protein
MPNTTQNPSARGILSRTYQRSTQFEFCGGRFKTEERLRQDLWWPKMEKDVQEHIDQCEPCQTTTNKGKPPDVPITGLPIA